MSKKKHKPNRLPKRPSHFATTVECIKWIKKSVYLIARGRINAENPNELTWITIGTGCVVAPNRMITAGHVIDEQQSKEELKHHRPGDKYYLIRHDDEGNWHYRIFIPEVNKNLFLYPEVDLGIIYLEEEFYQQGEQIFAHNDDFIRIDQNFRQIGTEIAVLGYPLCKLDFDERDINRPQIANILLRADSGIINCRYQIAQNVYRYEFTVAFNPGNSGGPIFDNRTGQLLSIVHGYRATAINMREHVLSEEEKKAIDIKEYKENSFIDTVHANYSVGYATPSFGEIFRQHGIV
jgi:V8-like Glu-specific endopeptidase